MKTANSQLPPIHQVDNHRKMEGELKLTRKELETTKQALKVQAARCRHLVTAFTRKLAERDAELKACRQQREKQLSSLLRALLVLEARLRREQKSIKEMLIEKDNLINNQKLEIERLKSEVKQSRIVADLPAVTNAAVESMVVEVHPEHIKETGRMEVYAKPDLISSLGIPDGGKDCGPDSLSSDSTRSCLGDESDYTVIAAPQVKVVLNVHDRSAFSPISKIKERRLSFSSFSQSAPDISKGVPQDENMKPSTLLQEISIGDGHDKYLDNPVLQCVNQILLKDQEDFLEEQRLQRAESGAEVMRARDWLDEEESPIDGDVPDDIGLQPTPTLEVALQLPKKSMSLTDLNEDKVNGRLNPPLPPKPKVSGSKKVEFAPQVDFHNPSLHVVTSSQSMDHQQFDLSLSMLEPLDQGQDKDLYVISNSALDDDIVKQLRGRTLNVSGLHIKPQRMNNDRNQHSNVPTGLLHPNHNPRPKSPIASSNFESNNVLFTPPRTPPSSKVLKVNIQESPKRSGFCFMSPPKVGMPNMIKVASPVATLLTSGSAEEAAAQDDMSPSVSQMVRKFEDLGTPKKELDECNEDSRASASSAESSPARMSKEGSPNSSTSSVAVSYDNFLEATGLSQKSIITPSRMMTNHRNVTRPKDIKLRSKGKSAGVIERCIPPQVVGPTVKYWTEPYL